MSVRPHPVALRAGPRWLRLIARLLPVLLGGLVLALPAAAQQQAASPRPRVAILEFQRIGVSEAEGAALTDRLRTDFVNLRAYTVLDRAQTEQVLKEQAFQQEGVTDPNQAVRIGKMLNVEYIVTGRVTRLPNAYQVNAQMILVETAEVIRSETLLHRGDIIGLLSENMATFATRLGTLTKAAPPPPSPPPTVRPPPVVAQPMPAPTAPPPAEVAGPPVWPLAVGGLALGLGLLMEMSAISDSGEAVDKASEARSKGNPALYNEATALQSDAEATESTALLMMGLGIGLLVYYTLQDAPSGGTAASPPPQPFRVEVRPRSVAASYVLRW